MKHFKIFVDLTRLNKPIGFMLLFWPCSWGLAYAYNFQNDLNFFLYYLLLFFLGSVLMRSAGCIFNDIVDKDIDSKVERTKLRPIASGKISIFKSACYISLLCLFALLVLIQFNFLTIVLGMASMTLAFTYPFMKRITYWPQLFLGLTFNWGIILAYSAINNDVSYEIFVLYTSAIFWTLGYDTIYGLQDMVDDEIIGIKSTSIKFKKNIKLFVGSCYSITFFTIIYLTKQSLGVNIFTVLLILFFLSLIYQLIIFDKENEQKCLKAFKFNNISGLLMFFAFISESIQL